MTRRISWIVTALFAVIALIIGAFAYNGGTYTVVITTEEAQARLNESLRKQADDKRVRMESATIRFADNAIHIQAKVVGTTRTRVVRADLKSTGTPEYRGGSFYFHPTSLAFENVQIAKGVGTTSRFQKTRELLLKRATEFITEHGWENVLETFRSELKEWIDTTAQKTVAHVLTSRPLYTLKSDAKGMTVKAVLSKVEVVDDKLHITLSLAQLGYSIFASLAIMLLVIGLTIALITNPELVLFGALFGAFGS